MPAWAHLRCAEIVLVVASPVLQCHDVLVETMGINGIALDEYLDTDGLSTLERENLAAEALQQMIANNVGHEESDYHFRLLDQLHLPSEEALGK